MKRLLRSDQTLFRDPDVFDFAYMPDHLHHRDAQLRELAFLLQGAGPRNAVLRGPPGTGKTTTVRRAFSELTGEFIPVYVNCRQNHTLLAVYRCGVEGAELEHRRCEWQSRRVPSARGEVKSAPLLHFRPAWLFFMLEEDYSDSIVCCGGTSIGCIPRRIRGS